MAHLLLQDFGCFQEQALLADGVAANQEQRLVLVVLLRFEGVDDKFQHLHAFPCGK